MVDDTGLGKDGDSSAGASQDPVSWSQTPLRGIRAIPRRTHHPQPSLQHGNANPCLLHNVSDGGVGQQDDIGTIVFEFVEVSSDSRLRYLGPSACACVRIDSSTTWIVPSGGQIPASSTQSTTQVASSTRRQVNELKVSINSATARTKDRHVSNRQGRTVGNTESGSSPVSSRGADRNRRRNTSTPPDSRMTSDPR